MPSATFAVAFAASALLAACHTASSAPGAASDPAERSTEPGEPFRVLGPHELAPAFQVVAVDGTRIDSSSLIGHEPFVVVFFATWCHVCELKLPETAELLREGAPIQVVGVSLDAPGDYAAVPGFTKRMSFSFPVVRGDDFPRFALAYDPMQTVPVVAVVGANGYLVDYQIGYSATHRARLAAALEVARSMPPDAPPFLGGRTRDDPGQ
jgi:peroxiredoxin